MAIESGDTSPLEECIIFTVKCLLSVSARLRCEKHREPAVRSETLFPHHFVPLVRRNPDCY